MGDKNMRLLVLFGNQLFSNGIIREAKAHRIFMAESEAMCRRYRAHRHKLVLILSAMRSKADALRKAGHDVEYQTLAQSAEPRFLDMLSMELDEGDYGVLLHYETESPPFEARLEEVCAARGIERITLESPKFMTSREAFRRYRDAHQRLFMAEFYRWQRKDRGILLEQDDEPVGGRWSFDEDNRKKLPDETEPPSLAKPKWTSNTEAVVKLVDDRFREHRGRAEDFWLPTTEAQARAWLDDFLEDRFHCFGDYEDALSRQHRTLFHSVLSPLLNIGLLTPARVVDEALAHAEANQVPINSLEGFVRQVIGWREFIRGVWNTLPPSHWNQSFWGHERQLGVHWYDATTGVPPLDDAIRRAVTTGYNHHIERLMVIGNMMLLCRVEPQAAYRWFMEMYVDSDDWVMAPNVYGMALFSEGGAFTTKPYICGSNYLRKMSDYPKGEWCDVVDGLYWSFIEDHRDFFESNPRSKMVVGTLVRMGSERKQRIFAAAKDFTERVTE